MKHILLLSFLAISSVTAWAQSCTPDPAYSNAGAGVYPATIATVNCSNVLSTKTIVSITDTLVHVTNPFPLDVNIYFDSTRVVSVTGLPAGLTFGTDVNAITNAANPYGAWINGGAVPNLTAAVGCVYITGPESAWIAAASGGVGGVYMLSFAYDARIQQTNPDVSGVGVPNGTWLADLDPGLGGGTIPIEVPLDVNPTNLLDATVSGPISVDANSSYNYSAVLGATSYVWVVTGGTIQSGQGTDQITVIWDGGSPTGNVEVTVGDGTCEKTGNMEITSIVTGIAEANTIEAVVYPNPSTGIFNIQIPSAGLIDVQITDISGRNVLVDQLQGSSNSMDLGHLPAGMYILSLETSEGSAITRLIKQ